MNVTEKLKQEHQLILRYIDLFLNYLSTGFKGQDEFSKEKILLFVEFIQKYSDEYHHSKEEQILFKYLERPGVLSHCNPIPQMLYEHENGRQYVKNIVSAVEKNDCSGIVENGKAWAFLLQEHISKEDNILYPMAEEDLSQEFKLEILKEYQRVEENDKCRAIETKFQQLVQQLIGEL